MKPHFYDLLYLSEGRGVLISSSKRYPVRSRLGESSQTTLQAPIFQLTRGKHLVLRPLLEVEMSKKCTPLWREAYFQVKMYEALGCGPLLAVERSKKCTPLWREAHFEVKMYKAHHVRTTFGSEMSKKCTPLWREAHFQVKMYKTLGVRTTFGGSDVEKVHAVVARSTFRSQKC